MNGTNHESRRNPMLTKPRWEAEVALMANLFPAFRPFAKDGMVGFHGLLQGPCSGRTYAASSGHRLTAIRRSHLLSTSTQCLNRRITTSMDNWTSARSGGQHATVLQQDSSSSFGT